jgi:hypothetical protein
MRPIVRPETPESNYQHTPRKTPEERRTQIERHCGSAVQINIHPINLKILQKEA